MWKSLTKSKKLMKQNQINYKLFLYFISVVMVNNDNFFSKIYDFGRLIRFFNAVTSSFALWLGATLAGSSTNVKVVHGMLVAFLLTAASNIHNDILDQRIDKWNQPTKPLVREVFQIKFSYLMLFLFILIGFVLTLFWEFYFSLTYCVLVLLSLFYNKYGKKVPVLGNVIVSFIGAMVPLLGAKIGGSIEKGVHLSLIVFTVFLIREVIKDIQDRRGDLLNHVKTLSFYVTLKSMKWIIVVLSSLSIILLFMAFPVTVLTQFSVTFLLFIACILIQIFILYFVFKIDSYDFPIWGKLSSWMKYLLILGIFTFLSHCYGI